MNSSTTDILDTSIESRVRRKARRMRYRVHKSRKRKFVTRSYNYGEYMLVDSRGIPFLGWNYDATLMDIEACLDGWRGSY